MHNYYELYNKLKPKYFLDRILAYPVFFLISPLILLGAWAVKADSWFNSKDQGSVFYWEPRVSAGRIFKIIKFRTVTQEIVEWVKKAPGQRSITAAGPKTIAGRLILKMYLDELPQIINIIKGDMSFVGPRPHIYKQHKQEINAGLIYRNFIKAGFFGVPQACKRHPRYRKMMEEMAKTHEPNIELLNSLDGLYIKKCFAESAGKLILFDLWIIARCTIVVLRGGAEL